MSGTPAEFVQLKERDQTFSLSQTDKGWWDCIGKVLHECGYHVLHPDHTGTNGHLSLVCPHIHSGDEGLIKLLNEVEVERMRSTSVICKMNIIRYFSSRCGQADLLALKHLPIFLLSSRQYTSLDEPGTRYVCVQDEERLQSGHSEDLQKLTIPGMCHLAYPDLDMVSVYKQLGVVLVSSSTFCLEYVCPHLATAAEAGIKATHPGTGTLPVTLAHQNLPESELARPRCCHHC